jgi:hypothetical protein
MISRVTYSKIQASCKRKYQVDQTKSARQCVCFVHLEIIVPKMFYQEEFFGVEINKRRHVLAL